MKFFSLSSRPSCDSLRVLYEPRILQVEVHEQHEESSTIHKELSDVNLTPTRNFPHRTANVSIPDLLKQPYNPSISHQPVSGG